MKNYIYILLTIIGVIGIFSSCEKDETKTIIKDDPTAPSLVTLPNLELKRENASDTLQFIGTKADFGFSSSVVYNLEADLVGNQFQSPILLASNRVDTFNITVNEINSALINTLPLDETLSMELRVRARLNETEDIIEVISDVVAASIRTYGPASLTFSTFGTLQTLTSPEDNKIYSGTIHTDGTPFLLTNKDDGKEYGITSNVLTENGPTINLDAGSYNAIADLNTDKMTLVTTEFTVCMIGDATPGGWGTDTKMYWGFTDHTWNINGITISAGGLKFRTFGGWANVNVAFNPAGHDLNNLYQSLPGADSENIDIIAPGIYNVKLYLETTPMKVIFTPAK